MEFNKKYLYIGAVPDEINKHPGGQATSANGLFQYCLEKKIELDVIDSSQTTFPYPNIYKRLFRSVKRNLKLYKKIKNNKYSGLIIFCGDGLSFIEKSFSCFIAKLFKTKALLFIRSGFFIDELQNSRSKKIIYRILLNIPHKIILQGTNWLDLMITLGINKEKLEIIHNWANREITIQKTPKLSDNKEKINFLFVGWLVKEKGLGQIIDALKNSNILNNQNFSFIGDGPFKKNLLDLKRDKRNMKIKIHGWLTNSEVINSMKENDVLVFPSHAEGFPNVIVEALSQGMPLITTNVGGITDSAIDNKNAFIVPIKDSNSLKIAMEKFVIDKSLIEKFSRESCKIFSINHQNENCKKIFSLF